MPPLNPKSTPKETSPNAAEPQVLTKAEAEALRQDLKSLESVELPPPGDARRDEILRRQDALDAKLDKLLSGNNAVETFPIDLKNFEPDNEILQHLQSGNYPVSNPDPAYTYCWVQRDIRGSYGGIHILRKKMQGWQLVRHGYPETAGIKHVDGTAIVGDVVLMKIRKDLYVKIHQYYQREVDRRREGGTAKLKELAEKHHVTVHEELDDKTLQRMQNKANAERTATQMTDKWIKQGKMPGVPGPQTTR